MRIRSKIQVFFLVVALTPTAIFGITSYFEARRSLIAAAGEQLVTLTRAEARALRNLAAAWREVADQIASRQALRETLAEYNLHKSSAHRARMTQIIRAARLASGDLLAVTIIGADGSTAASTDLSRQQMRWAPSELVDVPMLSQRTDGRIVVRVSAPMNFEGVGIGQVSVEINAARLNDSVTNHVGLGETGAFQLARRMPNGDAEFIAPTRHDLAAAFNRVVSAKRGDSPIIGAFDHAEAQLIPNAVDWRGARVLAAGIHLPGSDWALVASKDFDEAVSPATALGHNFLMLGLGIALALAALGYCLGRATERFLARMAAASRAVADGHFRDLPVPGIAAELNAFVESFNTMSKRLQAARDDLTHSEERYRSLAECSPDPVIVRTDDRILYCNDAAVAQFGYRDKADLMSVHPRETMHPDDRKRMKRDGDRFLGGDTSVAFDLCRRKRKDGSIFNSDARRTRITWNGENAILLAITDLSERADAEEKLRDYQNRYRQFAELSPDAIVVRDEEKLLYANSAAARIFGYPTAEEMIGLDAAANIHPDDRDRVREIAARTLDGEQTPLQEMRQIRKNGTSFHVESRRAPIKWGGGDAILVSMSDITARRMAEQALQESEQRYREIAELLPDAMLVLHEHRIAYCNSAAVKLFGYADMAEMMGTAPIDLVHPNDRDRVMEATEEVFSGAVVPPMEVRRLRRDGSSFLSEARRGRIVWEGEPAQLLVITDITDRRAAELRIRDANAELRSINEEVRRFTYIVSHDLKAPLVNIRGFSDELKMTFEDVKDELSAAGLSPSTSLSACLDEDIPESLGFIETSVAKMEGMIQSILTLSRVGRHEIRNEDVDMNEIAESAVDGLRYMIDAGDIDVVLGDLPVLHIDRAAIEQIVGNIVENAVKYLSADRRGRIEISGGYANGFATLSVSDNGRGIAADDIPKIFELFRRVGSAEVPGTGMGLTYTQAFVHRLGGTLECESELGTGTTFTLSFPQVTKAKAA